MKRPVAVVLMLLASACQGRHVVTKAQANQVLRGMVDSSATAVAQGMTITARPEASLPEACTNVLGKDKGTLRFGYQVALGLRPDTDIPALLNRARDYWKSKGYDVGSPPPPGFKSPSVGAENRHYIISLAVQEERGIAVLGGSTPCVKDAEESKPGG
jgi:hypothetical protein